jgi:hypothetical protein
MGVRTLRRVETMSGEMIHARIHRRATLIPSMWMPALIADPLRRCQHPAQLPIYGDEIIAAGWRRARCLICGRLLPNLPTPEQDVTRP